MRTTYELTATLQCPKDQKLIAYSVTLEEDDKLIEVETILAEIEKIAADGPIMQEPFTETLASRLAALGHYPNVTTVGVHSGVKITCSA